MVITGDCVSGYSLQPDYILFFGDSGLCAADCTVHKFKMWPNCRHVESSVHIVTTVLQTVNAP